MSNCCCAKPLFDEASQLAQAIAAAHLYPDQDDVAPFRVAAEPFALDKETMEAIRDLGPALFHFNSAVQDLYFESKEGRQPAWVQAYLDMGKPDLVKDYARMRRFRQDVPRIIRPDLILTDNGFSATELDSVPGGFGLTACLSKLYEDRGTPVVGGAQGILTEFMNMIKDASGMDRPTTAIVVSDEAVDYLGEMQWLASGLREQGYDVETIHPKDIEFQEDGLYMGVGQNHRRIHAVYRFFELFDLKNIPKIDLILYAVRKQLAVITPPIKHIFEEKLLFGLFHHPQLQPYWQKQLGTRFYELLQRVFPESWIVDNRPLPPHGVIPGLEIGGVPVSNWSQLFAASKKERQLVLKISGFSPNAWGSRGVTIGHDVNGQQWQDALEEALESFDHGSPFVLQRFRKGKKVSTNYYEETTGEVQSMQGRVRLCPYYFVSGDEVTLGGILATICPLNKKLIHGMSDAVMVPVAQD